MVWYVSERAWDEKARGNKQVTDREEVLAYEGKLTKAGERERVLCDIQIGVIRAGLKQVEKG